MIATKQKKMEGLCKRNLSSPPFIEIVFVSGV
jgi:hypothetical protein